MPSDRETLTTLANDLRRLGRNRTADELNDIIALAARKRWSATVLLEHIVAAELGRKTAPQRREPAQARPARTLQTARRLELGLAHRAGAARSRAHPHARLPRPPART